MPDRREILRLLTEHAEQFCAHPEFFIGNRHMHSLTEPVSPQVLAAVVSSFLNYFCGNALGIDLAMYEQDLLPKQEPCDHSWVLVHPPVHPSAYVCERCGKTELL